MIAPTNEELQAQANANGAVFVNESKLKKSISKVDFIVHPGSSLTICIITLLNGYTVTGESACADPKMFNAEIGRKFAFIAAERKIWPLLGYALKQELYLNSITDFKDRVRNEAKELSDNINKLTTFINGNVHFINLPVEDQLDLLSQKRVMMEYLSILEKRINKFSKGE